MSTPLDPQIDPQTVQKKLRMVRGLIEIVFEIKSHQLRRKNPQASDEEIKKMTLEMWVCWKTGERLNKTSLQEILTHPSTLELVQQLD